MARSFQIDCSDVSDLCRSESGSSAGSSGLFYHTPTKLVFNGVVASDTKSFKPEVQVGRGQRLVERQARCSSWLPSAAS